MSILSNSISIYLDLPLLLIIVSLIYAATRHDRWDKILSEAIHWGIRIVIFLLSIGLILYIISL
jgi:hypothetical protein